MLSLNSHFLIASLLHDFIMATCENELDCFHKAGGMGNCLLLGDY